MKIKKADILLIGIIAVLAIGALIFYTVTREEGAKVVIRIDDAEYERLSLDKDQTREIDSGNGQYNILVIKDGYAFIEEANCPNQDCVHQKSIHYNNEKLTCLPHKVVVTVSSSEEAEVDNVAN